MLWTSDGLTGTYQLGEADNVAAGTKIVLHLKKDSAEFAREKVVETIIRKYSNFIGVPVFLNGKQLNVIEPLWTKDASKVRETFSCVLNYLAALLCHYLLIRLVNP